MAPTISAPDASRKPGSFATLRPVIATVVLAVLLGVVIAIDPWLGAACFMGLVALTRVARSGTFAVSAFLFASYAEVVAQSSGFSPIKLMGVALIVTAVALVLQPAAGIRRVAWFAHPIIVLSLAAYVVVAIASFTWAEDIGQVRILGLRIAADAAVFLAITMMVRRERQLLILGWVALAGAFASTVYGLVSGANIAERFIGASLDPNEYAALVVPSLGLAYGAVTAARSRMTTVLGWSGMALCIWGLAASQSRGGLVGMFVLLFVLIATARGQELRRMLAAGAVVSALLLGYVAVTPAGDALRHRIVATDSSGRTDLWRVAWNMAEAHPFIGIGLGNFPVLSARYLDPGVQHVELFVGAPRAVHNAPLEVLAELGLLGLASIITFVLGCVTVLVRSVRVARRHCSAQLHRMGRSILAALLSVLGTNMFLSGQYQEMLWVLLALALAYAAIVASARADMHAHE